MLGRPDNPSGSIWHMPCLRQVGAFVSVTQESGGSHEPGAPHAPPMRPMPPLRAGRRARSLGAYLAVVLTLVGACDRIQRDSPAGDTGELPDQEVSDFSVTETDEGRLEWKMYARNAAIYNARDAIVAHGVRVDFYDEAGKQTSTLTAREGEMNQVRHDMIARGNVVLQTTEGTRMSTEELRFLNQTQRIVSDGFVRVERRSDVLTGYGFESDPDLKHYEFKHQVQAVVRTQSGGTLKSNQRTR
ncbi:MAG: LPS export ABC transporter periplasmic protein LptC [Candidatus Eisenbacteria bacterium]|uniref:LPS export ABC transporter periplasmic protein LptC n=1 Tax=Eiseniibacteriota bacterium TaxID=2212470 RepID=A0A538TLZ3_UNCEI|nr:MAG: LPS export ABC transporter periplasmic protein LptC [Candidatus Eisenbacteria bacterium]